MSSQIAYGQPLLQVLVNGKPQGRVVISVFVSSDLCDRADTALLELEALLSGSGDAFKRGASVDISWGYGGSGQALASIFQGYIVEIARDWPRHRVRCLDPNVILNSRKIVKTFQGETADGIVRAVLEEAGIAKHQLARCDWEIERLPFSTFSARQCIDSVTDLVRKRSGQAFYDYFRGGVFYWEPKDYSQAPAAEFRTGRDIISFRRAEVGLSRLETLITPVGHSQVIEIDGDKWFVERAIYRWCNKGRTELWVEPCP